MLYIIMYSIIKIILCQSDFNIIGTTITITDFVEFSEFFRNKLLLNTFDNPKRHTIIL